MRRRALAPITLALALSLAACAPDAASTAEDQPTAGAATLDAETVAIGSALAQMRGHLRVAAELSEAGDQEGTITHAAHPGSELLSLVRSELEEHDVDAGALETALTAVTDLAGAGAPDEEIAPAIEAAIEATREAESAFAGDVASDDAYVGSVIADLLATAAHEYEEAVVDGELQQAVEYQDGYAFVLEARDLYDRLADAVEAASAEEAEEIAEAFATLGEALPSAEPPDELAPVEDIEAATSLIGHELEETVGALAVTESDPDEVAAEINRLLDDIVTAVEEDRRDEAAELAAEAYLDNYEVIEAGVIAAAPDINEELEPLLGAELRRQIDDGAGADEIAAMVDRARDLLAEAIEALGEEGH